MQVRDASTARASIGTGPSAYNRRFLELLPTRRWVRRVTTVRARDACDGCRLPQDNYDAHDPGTRPSRLESMPPLEAAARAEPA